MQNVKHTVFLKLLGKQIKKIRKKRGFTQLELAVKIDNHAEQIGRIERGEHNVSSCTLYLIAKGLEVSIKELFDFEIPLT